MAIQYYSQQATLTGTPQTFTPGGFVWAYVEVHNLGVVPYMVQFNNASYPLPAGGRLALQVDVLPSTQPDNAVTVTGTGSVLVYMTSAPPVVPVLQQNALGGGSGGVYTADNVTLQEALNQFSIKPAGVGVNEIAAAIAGGGLVGGAGSPLAVNPDNSTLEVVADQVRVKDLGVTTAKLANTAVTDPKVATDALSGYHVNRAINVSTPAGQLIILGWSGLAVPDDTFELTVTYGLAGTTVVQEFIFDPTGPLLPGQIAILTGLSPAMATAVAINAWATTLPVPLRISAYSSSGLASVTCIAFHDEDAISCDSSGMQWTGATPTNVTVDLQPIGNQLPTPQPLMFYRRTVTAAEAACFTVFLCPSTQEDLYYGPPSQSLPLLQVWRQVFPNVWSVIATNPTVVTNIAPPTGWMLQISDPAIVAGDVVVAMWGSSVDGRVSPAITPRP